MHSLTLQHLKTRLRRVRADWITLPQEETVISTPVKRVPDWVLFGVSRGLLLRHDKGSTAQFFLSPTGFTWVESWKHNYCLSGKKI